MGMGNNGYIEGLTQQRRGGRGINIIKILYYYIIILNLFIM